jgi:hypothetical protein
MVQNRAGRHCRLNAAQIGGVNCFDESRPTTGDATAIGNGCTRPHSNRRSRWSALMRGRISKRDDENWLKHTLSWLDRDGTVRLDYRPVYLQPLTNETALIPPRNQSVDLHGTRSELDGAEQLLAKFRTVRFESVGHPTELGISSQGALCQEIS